MIRAVLMGVPISLLFQVFTKKPRTNGWGYQGMLHQLCPDVEFVAAHPMTGREVSGGKTVLIKCLLWRTTL